MYEAFKKAFKTASGESWLEERDITQKIKATDIASSEENKELSNLLFKELLRDKNKFRYHINKTDYSIGRYLDGHTQDGRYDNDLRVETVSPLDADYNQLSEAACIRKSSENEGQALIKLPDDRAFYSELKTRSKHHRTIYPDPRAPAE